MAQETNWIECLDSVREGSLGGVVVDEGFAVRAISDGVLRRTGMSRHDALGKSILDFFHPSDIGHAAAVIGQASPGDASSAPGVYRVVASSGTWDIYELSITHLGEAGENAVVLDFSIAGDSARSQSLIDETVELTKLLVEPTSLRDSLRDLADFAERNVDRLCVAITVFSEDGSAATFCQRDLDAATTEMNSAAHPLSLPHHVVEAFSKAKLRSWRSDSEVGTIMPDRPDRVTMVLLDFDDNILGYVDAFRSSKAPPQEDEWRVYRLAIQMLRAVMLNAQLDARLDFLGLNDPLTGVTNRHQLLSLMNKVELEDSGVLVINLDGFAWVNQSMGFEAGDTVLRSVAASLLAFVPPSAVTARLSGDEFLVWLPMVDSDTELFRLAEQMRTAISVPIDNSDRRGRTRCSIGSTRAIAGESADHVIHRAAEAMMKAKTEGGDRVTHAE